MTRALSGLLAATVLVASAAFAQQAAGKRAEFNIPPQALDSALLAFADQANVQLAVSADRIEGLKTKGVRGAMTADGALRSLLADTGLTFRAVGARSYSVGDPAQGAGTTSSSDPPATKPAHVAPPGERNDVSPKPADTTRSESDKPGETSMETITVTGTLIRDAMPIGAPLKVYGRKEIERSGAATTDQFIREIPENLASVDTSAGLAGQATGGFSQNGENAFAGSGVNLRGMGPTATLVLFNGRRMAGSGLSGSFVDISQIPLAALERVEVLTDGASALYGSDAIAGVVNFIVRRDFEGMESSLRYGGATRGGADELAASHLAGAAWSSGNAMLSLSHYQYDGLTSADRDFIPDAFDEPASIIPEDERNHVFGAIRQQLGGIELVADVLYGEREFGAGTPIAAGINSFMEGTVDTLDTGASLERRWGEWATTLAAGFSSQKQFSQSTVVGIPVELPSSGVDTRQTTVDLRADGPLFQFAAGTARAAIGAGFRTEKLIHKVGDQPGLPGRQTEFERDVSSVYGEVVMPVFSPKLELSIAGRFDDYEDVGSSTNPRVGLAWTPAKGFTLRSTYGTSFRSPALPQRVESRQFLIFDTPDSAAADGVTTTLINLSSGNSTLQPEEGETFTAGFSFAPSSAPALTISSTYFRVEYADRIANPPLVGDLSSIFDQQATLAPFTDRTPDPAEVQAIFANDPVFDFTGRGVGPGDVEGTYDHRIVNIAESTQSGVELAILFDRETSNGRVGFSLAGIRTLELDYQPASTTPAVTLLDLVGFPVGMKVVGGMNWSYRGFASSLSIVHLDDYENQLVTPRDIVDSWTTADLQLSYQTSADTGFASGLTMALNVNNITDEEPPFVDVDFNTASVNAGYDPTNASPLGRVISVQLAKRW
jgi:outer membrane receptor protein involved in Fe transport